ncbi:MAG TPA: ComF family protein [Candidatus Aquabacterium excrementipullorum]|nr:ComF family protein [Candidatus Aquabacterium excrementipullorum]
MRLPETLQTSADDDGLCQACRDAPPGFDHAIAALDYAEPWSGLIASLKFREDTAMAGVLARLMEPNLRRRWQATARSGDQQKVRWKRGAPTAIIPVPLSASRLRERGYNQAGLLARHLGRQLGLPLWHDALARRKDTPRLMTLDADERLQHIRQAFEVSPRHAALLHGRHVAVVDDVLTTGATLNEIANTLWQAGAREVSVWVAARTPPPQDHHANPDKPGEHLGRAWDLG